MGTTHGRARLDAVNSNNGYEGPTIVGPRDAGCPNFISVGRYVEGTKRATILRIHNPSLRGGFGGERRNA